MEKGEKQVNQVFSGLKIVAFSWAMVGPLTLKFFADYGATVIRIETSKRPCVTRISSPFKDGKAGLNRSGYFNHFSANMMSVSLNMGHPRGIELAKELVAKSDVVMENFTPGVMDRWGLGYEELKKVKPDIIMVRQNGFGTEGPYRNLAAFGMILSATAGIPNFIGWPDRGPLPVGVGAYTDCISPRLASAALVAALIYRDKTGKGQLLDLAQYETALYFVLPGIMDYMVNGREPERNGNSSPSATPHNVYQCKGDDRWCTIAVFSDAQWGALCRTMGKPEYAADPRFDTLVNRKANEQEVDSIIGAWTRDHSAEDVMALLQNARVPAGIVENTADLYADPQLRHRRLLWPLNHSEIGTFSHLGSSFEMSKTPAEAKSASPLLGEHNEYVLTKILGKTDEEFVDLLTSGVLE
ncbi:MAG TPA: CoA transferase [Syntrophorhabdaceae bacterium]|nr:CoA transferase [Syntrophorhabdaceae bacterium]